MMQFQVFQMLVRRWVVRAFGQDVADNRPERTHRFLEEALELAQATDCTQEQAHALVAYVYGRPVGKPQQEVGGTLLTLAALCAARDFDMATCAAAELSRVNRPEMLERIREKQAAKRRDIPLSPLPEQAPPMHRLCTANLLDVRTNADREPRWWCPQCRVEVLPENAVPQPSGNPLDPPVAQRKPPLTHTDAVGTTGGKATVAKPI